MPNKKNIQYDFETIINDWSSNKQFLEAKNLSKTEIFSKYSTRKKILTKVPYQFIRYFNTKLINNNVYCSKAYFINHMVNHHPNLKTKDYLYINKLINNPKKIYKDTKNENIIFLTPTKNNYKILVLGIHKKTIIYKSYFIKRVIPTKYELLKNNFYNYKHKNN